MDGARLTHELPRLLYLADVPVESSYAGSALLYRLLQRYPAPRVRIIEGNLFPPGTTRRLPDVAHRTLHVGNRRLLNSRFHHWYTEWLTRTAALRRHRIEALLEAFQPQAVLTVGHGYSWITASRFAVDANLPLHFIVHDDWPTVVGSRLQPLVDRQFQRVYTQAASRLCVSPFMVAEYERRYGASGTVMLPQRAPNVVVFPPVARAGHAHGLVYAFAGTINSEGTAELIRRFASALEARGAELLIFGPLDPGVAAAAGLLRPNIRLRGLLPAAELAERLREEADVLFVPMSFAQSDQPTMRINFPSKLADYTTVGLPILIWGAPDSSAVRWATANDGVAEVVASMDPAALSASLERLASVEWRVRLATEALRVGERDFSAETAERIFHAALVA